MIYFLKNNYTINNNKKNSRIKKIYIKNMSTAKEWKDKGNSLVKEKKYKEALDCYTKAIKIDPNDPILYSNRSAMHLNLSEFDEAINDAEKAISLKPDYAKAYLRKGKALEGQQRIQEALDTYKL